MNCSRKEGRKYAFLVGISRFQYAADYRPLPNCEKDVHSFYETLTSEFDFEENAVTLLKNEKATYTHVKEKIERFSSDLEPDDTFIFFFASHGVEFENTKKHNGYNQALVLFDSEPDNADTHILDDWFVTLLAKKFRTRNVGLILDCCHSGDMTRGRAGCRGVSITNAHGVRFEGSNWFVDIGNHVVLSACLDFQKAYEHSVCHHGMLSGLLFDALKNVEKKREISWLQVYQLLLQQLEEYRKKNKVKQEPQLEGRQDLIFLGNRVITPELQHVFNVTARPVSMGAGTRTNASTNSSAGNTEYVLHGGLLHGIGPNSMWRLYAGNPESAVTTCSVAEVGLTESSLLPQTAVPANFGFLRATCISNYFERPVNIMLNCESFSASPLYECGLEELVNSLEGEIKNPLMFNKVSVEEEADLVIRWCSDQQVVLLQKAKNSDAILNVIIWDIERQLLLSQAYDRFVANAQKIGFRIALLKALEKLKAAPENSALASFRCNELKLQPDMNFTALHGQQFQIDVSPKSENREIYVSILYFDSGKSIGVLYPPAGGHKTAICYSSGRKWKKLKMINLCSLSFNSSPNSSIFKENGDSMDVIYAIVTSEATDMQPVQQEGLQLEVAISADTEVTAASRGRRPHEADDDEGLSAERSPPKVAKLTKSKEQSQEKNVSYMIEKYVVTVKPSTRRQAIECLGKSRRWLEKYSVFVFQTLISNLLAQPTDPLDGAVPLVFSVQNAVKIENPYEYLHRTASYKPEETCFAFFLHGLDADSNETWCFTPDMSNNVDDLKWQKRLRKTFSVSSPIFIRSIDCLGLLDSESFDAASAQIQENIEAVLPRGFKHVLLLANGISCYIMMKVFCSSAVLRRATTGILFNNCTEVKKERSNLDVLLSYVGWKNIDPNFNYNELLQGVQVEFQSYQVLNEIISKVEQCNDKLLVLQTDGEYNWK